LQASRNVLLIPPQAGLRLRIGLRLALRRDPRLWNHF
jgi:hypothetical protein